MRVIGIDPGIALTGYAIVEADGNNYVRLASGCIRTSKDLIPAERLKIIFSQLKRIVVDYAPQAFVIEKLFFSKNVATAFQVGEARGVAVLSAALSGLEVFEYTPLQVKQSVAGYGKADKRQVQKMVQLLLGLSDEPLVDDESDAMAIAICHLQSKNWQDAVKGGKH